MSRLDHSPRAGVAAPLGDGVATARTPDFFIVGHQKCGTTALYMMLSQHPEIFMPDVKEPWFFGRELRSRFAKPSTRSRPNTLEDYLELFADAAPDQVAGEASPQTIRSLSAAREIAALRPDAKIVVLLREPAAFLRSLHLQLVVTNIEDEPDFGKALALEQLRRSGERIPRRSVSPQSLLYSDHVRYAEQLERLHESFPPQQVLVLIYDEFRRDNAGTVARVLDFLGVDAGAVVEPVETKKLKDVRSMRLHQLRWAVRRAGLNPAKRGRFVRTVDAIAPKSLGSDSIAGAFRRVAYRSQRAPDERLMLELHRRFKPEVVALGERLDRDLVALWGYEDIS
jgi:DNA-binding NarL/FixJ family response regulator